MRVRPLLPALACLLLAAVPARSGPVPQGPEASGRGIAAPHGPEAGKLVPGTAFDGHAILGLDYPVFGEEGGLGGRGGLVGRWNPAFHGWSARLAAAASIRGAPILGGRIQAASTRTTRFAYELDEAWLRYPIRAGGWSAAFQAGRFRWRSHADAALTGEYLARWSAYPIRIVRVESGYEPLDSLTTVLQGLRFALASPGRIFGQEILAVVDNRDGMRFLTVIGSATLAPLPGVEAAIGVALHEPMESRDSYAYSYPVLDAGGQVVRDTATGEAQRRYADIEFRSRTYAARLSLDLATLVLGEARSDRGGRLFAEAALLGWEDYPFYYPGKSRRIQFSAGLHLPTFGILDIARLQAERQAYPAAYHFDLTPFGSPVSETMDAGPSHWWSGQIHLTRSLFPWLEVQGLAQCELRRKVNSSFYFSTIPVPGADAPPQSGSGAEEALWSFQARITARL